MMRALWLIETAVALGILIWTIAAPAEKLGIPVLAAGSFFVAVMIGDGLHRLWRSWRQFKELKR